MKQDSYIFAFIGFIIGIIPYLLLIIIINDKLLTSILTIFGLITSIINGYIFYNKIANLKL